MLSKLQALASVPMFHGLPEELLGEVLSRCADRVYERGETVFVEGEPTRGLFVIWRGRLKVYKVGDSFTLENGYRLVTDIPLCMHSLASLLPHYNALRVSEPENWGLAGSEDRTKAYVQCLDAVSYTDGGTAIFEISRAEE